MAMEQGNWIRVLDARDLTRDKPRTVKPEGKQIVLFRLDDDTVHAIDNRCPHEGYPLSTGMLADGVLTCEWHNWKFRLCDGACVLGGEDVRWYPLRIEDGGIWLDITDPPIEDATPDLYRSLADAFDDDDWGWAGRTVERLLVLGEPAEAILGRACDWAAVHAPYGFDHGLATAADLGWLMAQAPEVTPAGAVVPLLEAMNLMVHPNLRRPARVMAAPESVSPPPDGDWTALENELRRRIEAEDQAGAEGLFAGALAAGARPEHVFGWLVHAATDHFLGYGHAHIYCVKAEELLQRIGWQHAHPVLTSLVARIIYSTREDKLPYMREYNRLMQGLQPRLAAWTRPRAEDEPTTDGDAGEIVDALITAAVDGTLEQALTQVADALERGIAPERIALASSVAAAYRILRFDERLEHDDRVVEDWLSITHALTHADAVRETLLRRPSRDALRGLFQSARFIQHLAPCDAPLEVRACVPEHAGAATDAAAETALTEALRGYRAAEAMAITRAAWPERSAGVRRALYRAVLADRATVPIFVAHHVKTTMAALRLTDALHLDPVLSRRPDRDLPLCAAVRFLAHPLQERRVARSAQVSHDFVRQGRMQTKLRGY